MYILEYGACCHTYDCVGLALFARGYEQGFRKDYKANSANLAWAGLSLTKRKKKVLFPHSHNNLKENATIIKILCHN